MPKFMAIRNSSWLWQVLIASLYITPLRPCKLLNNSLTSICSSVKTWCHWKLALLCRRSLPRVGVHLGTPEQYKQVQWYGRGPHESYPDRIYGAPVRVYSLEDAAKLHTPYIFPGIPRGLCRTCGIYNLSWGWGSVCISISAMHVGLTSEMKNDTHRFSPDAAFFLS